MDQVQRDIQAIYQKGAQALEAYFWPGKVAHLAIDWQRLYCDPNFVLNQLDLQRTQKTVAVLDAVNDFADAVRISTPTWWVYHDPALTKDAFHPDYFLCMNPFTVERRIAQFREQGRQLCGRVDPEVDMTLRKPFKDAFAGTDLHERLQRREIDTLLITGLYRHYSYDIRRAQCVGQTMKAAADLGYNTFVVEDLTVDVVEPTEPSRLAVAQMTLSEGAYSLHSDQVRRIAAKFQP